VLIKLARNAFVIKILSPTISLGLILKVKLAVGMNKIKLDVQVLM